ncbi:MAG: hypothetical protein JWL76_2266 [Thermoleophilia bacterium]|nr:hypothetical protein [Thermoleophilia bacterium]
MIEKVRIRGYRIHRDTTFNPRAGMNIIVGGNESGKSTLIEAVTLALTGRVNGRFAQEELNPHWFNSALVQEYLAARSENGAPELPRIEIEVFLADNAETLSLVGAHNSERPTRACAGVTFRVIPDPDALTEIEQWFASGTADIMPIEYYKVEWRSFRDEAVTRRPRNVRLSVIDSSTVRSSSGVDYHLRQILSEHLDREERAKISLDFRRAKHDISGSVFKDVNDKLAADHVDLHDRPVGLSMDQSSRTSWENSVTPHVDNIPFNLAGQGQQASIKIALAMNRESQIAQIVTIEEPENHLSHTSLARLLERIDTLAGEQQQLLVTTHSSFVLNRLGLDALTLVSDGSISRFEDDIPTDTVRYFQKLPGYDTLRVVLADRSVIVEGPSDEIVFERWYNDLFGRPPIRDGVDVISARGLSYKRFLQLAKATGKTVAVIRDNDNKQIEDLEADAGDLLAPGTRCMFVGLPADGHTLEPQIASANGDGDGLRLALRRPEGDDLAAWMEKNKTEAAIRIATSDTAVAPPPYMKAAAEFIHAG